ncbi:MAG: PEGA domain-containing protein [Archangium sp.]
MTTTIRLAVLMCVVAFATNARADVASEAELHFTLGLELYKQRKYEEALQHLVASNRLVPNANVVFNVAQIYGLLKRDADAFNWYETYLAFTSLDAAARERGQRAGEALLPRIAVLDVKANAGGAELFIDRVELGSVGAAPRRLAVSAGERVVIAKSAGFHEARATVTAVVGAVTPVELTLTPVLGKLVVESVPPGATVRREDGAEVLGVTPLTLELPLGELRVTLALEGYVEQQRSARISEESEVRLKVELTRAASTVSILSVSGAPEGARVGLAGKDLGTLPLVASDLTPGSYELTVDAPEREPYRARITLEPGAATRVDAQLVLPGGGKWRPLRWVGYGVGAGAVIAGAIVGLSAIVNRESFFARPNVGAYQTVLTENVTADVLLLSGLVTIATTLVLDQFVWPTPHTSARIEIVR